MVVLRDFNVSYQDFFQVEQAALSDFLMQAEVDSEIIKNILDSGYYLQGDYVLEGLYDRSGQIFKNEFLDIIKGAGTSQLTQTPPTFKIRSISDALNILSTHPYYSRYEDYISFRGQNKEHTHERSFPHPVFSNKDGKERLILPGEWRPYFKEGINPNTRPMSTDLTPLSPQHFFADELYYHGIDIGDLKRKNLERYGNHGPGDVEDFPDPESQEYAKRYQLKHKYEREVPLIEQHYGYPTVGLDVTFDIKTAIFFATHRFTIDKETSKATYRPIEGKSEGVLYLFRFSNPSLKKSDHLVQNVHALPHLPAIRPLRQSCAIPFFLSRYVNEAAANIIGIFEIDDNFDFSDSLNPEELFPNREEDPFYKAILELKMKDPEYFKEIIEYDFSL